MHRFPLNFDCCTFNANKIHSKKRRFSSFIQSKLDALNFETSSPRSNSPAMFKAVGKKVWKDVCTINLKIVVREARSIEHRGTQMARNLLMIMTVTKCFLWLPYTSGRAEYRSSFWTDFGRMPSTTFQLFFRLERFSAPLASLAASEVEKRTFKGGQI